MQWHWRGHSSYFNPPTHTHHTHTHTFSQQQEVLSELYHYTHQIPTPSDSFSAMVTLSYLEACNKIFEQGLLSHGKVTSSGHQVILNIQEGYKFFKNWLDEIYEMGMFCVHICRCACMCACMCMHVWVCMCGHVCVGIRAACILCVHMCGWVWAWMHVCGCACVCDLLYSGHYDH